MTSRNPLLAAVIAALIVVIGMGAVPPADAQLINPFAKDSLKLDDEDKAMMREAMRSVLESGKAATTKSWTNPKTGVSGTATLLRAYDENGMSCGEVEHAFTKPNTNRYILPFCKTPDGKWKVAL